MERWQKTSIAVLSVVTVALASFAIGYTAALRNERTGLSAEDLEGFGLIREAYEKIKEKALEPPSANELARGAIRGMVNVLKRARDPYALFFSPAGYRSLQELTTGRYSGIGVWLRDKEGDLTVVSVLPKSPALEAGLRKGDVIRAVNGKEITEMTIDLAVARIKGPEGSKVELEVERGDEFLSFSIERRSMELPNVVAKSTPDGYGYVQLLGFAHGAADQLREEVETLVDQGVEGMVLDLRDNGGGLFEEAIDVASVFIESGDIVIFRERDSDDLVYDAEGDAFEDLPLVVLVNEGTASASEIVAGALQDRERAIVVGETTYGKGSVQDVVQLIDASALKLTTAAYLTPDGRNIDGRGIEPDVEEDGTRRTQRLRAFEILRGIVLSSTDAAG